MPQDAPDWSPVTAISSGALGVGALRKAVDLPTGASQTARNFLPATSGKIYRLLQWGVAFHGTPAFGKLASVTLYTATSTENLATEAVTFPYHPSSNALAGLLTISIGYLAVTNNDQFVLSVVYEQITY